MRSARGHRNQALIGARLMPPVRPCTRGRELRAALARCPAWAWHCCGEIQVRSARRLGQELKGIELNKGGGDRRSDHPSHDARGALPTLKDLGLTYTQSSRWQRMVGIEKEGLGNPQWSHDATIGGPTLDDLGGQESQEHNEERRGHTMLPRHPSSRISASPRPRAASGNATLHGDYTLTGG